METLPGVLLVSKVDTTLAVANDFKSNLLRWFPLAYWETLASGDVFEQIVVQAHLV